MRASRVIPVVFIGATVFGTADALCEAARTSADHRRPAPTSSQSKLSAPATSPHLEQRLPYDGGEVPWGYRVESRPLYELLIPGAATASIGAVVLVVSLVLQAGVSCSPGDDSCESKRLDYRTPVIIGGSMLVGGLMLSMVGFAVRSESLVRDPSIPDTSRRPNAPRIDGFSLRLLGSSAIGLGLGGHF